MKPIFFNKTIYSENTYSEFLNFHSKTFIFSYLLNSIPIIGITLIIIFLHLKNFIILSTVILTIILLLYILYIFILHIQEVKKDFESVKNDDCFYFEFFDNFFTICKNKENTTSKFFYSNLFKIFETNNFFYLYIDKSHSFILDKNSFSDDILNIKTFFNTKKKIAHKNF